MSDEEAPEVEEEAVLCEFCMVWDDGLSSEYLETLNLDPMTVLKDEGVRYGFCRRNAPKQGTQGLVIWPLTKSEDWCGEFIPVMDEADMEQAISMTPPWMPPGAPHS